MIYESLVDGHIFSPLETDHRISRWWFQPNWKTMSQNGNLPQIGVNIKNMWNHHLDFCWCLKCLHKVLLSHFFETNCQVETPVCPSQHLLGAGKVIETHLVVWNAKPKKVTTKKTSLELPTPKKNSKSFNFQSTSHNYTAFFNEQTSTLKESSCKTSPRQPVLRDHPETKKVAPKRPRSYPMLLAVVRYVDSP